MPAQLGLTSLPDLHVPRLYPGRLELRARTRSPRPVGPSKGEGQNLYCVPKTSNQVHIATHCYWNLESPETQKERDGILLLRGHPTASRTLISLLPVLSSHLPLFSFSPFSSLLPSPSFLLLFLLLPPTTILLPTPA